LQDFLGGETEIPIFLAIKYQLIIIVKHDPPLFLSDTDPL
jgi:hypothetical protein